MALKNIFSTKKPDNAFANNLQPVIQQPPPVTRTYQQWGLTQAGNVDASPNALMPCLQATYLAICNTIAANKALQTQRKIPVRQKIAGLDADNANIDNEIIAAKDKMALNDNKIKQLSDEISQIKRNPEEVTGDASAKASFWIGIIIIALLTVYLFVFYSSAAYSAFLKNFTEDDTNIMNSIFDAQAITNAFNSGFGNLILILTIPAVFLGLGFLIHKFSEQENKSKYYKIAGLVITTFIFDCLIAYHIVAGIYSIEQVGSFQEMPDMTVGMAVQQINFWLIIFAGFIVYIIWGFVFDFVMIEYQKLNKVNTAIKNREKAIKQCESACNGLRCQIQQLQTKKNNNTGEINKLNIALAGIIVYMQDVAQDINNFFTGWLTYMQGAGKTQEQINECTEIRNRFFTSIPQHQTINNNN
ncbi:MAG: hypothetical protein LBP85_06875 [Prevotellaceae bacterium]|jgi:archaellum component FlaC|nr:hypothetical protein [Prevotellaceae bacterium]